MGFGFVAAGTDLVDLTGLSSSFTTIPATPAPALDISLDSSPVVGSTGSATVSLDLPAASSETVTLSASDPAIQLPPGIQFNAGQQTQDVPFTLGSGFDTTHVFALYATLGNQTAVTFGTKPNPNLPVGVTAQLYYPLTPQSTNVTVEPGESFKMFFGITSEGGYSGTFSSLTCNFIATIGSTSTCGLNEGLSFVCNGLPAGTQCSPQGLLYTSGPSTGFSFNYSGLAPNDYSFQIVGTADIVSHTINAVLQVGDFTASLDKTTATLTGGQSATFNVTLTSVNHYTSSITVFCQPPNGLTCAVSPLPATLTDDGTTTVQLTVTDTAAASRVRRAAWRSSGGGFLLACLVSLCFGAVRRKSRPLLALIAVTALTIMISCGSGSSGGGSPPPPPPQTVNISVVAQAASTQSDSGNQKTLGPIVITLN